MLVSQFTQGLGHCRAPFDPGAVIDDEGTGWLSFGGGGKGEVGTDYMPEDASVALSSDSCRTIMQQMSDE